MSQARSDFQIDFQPVGKRVDVSPGDSVLGAAIQAELVVMEQLSPLARAENWS
jgi:hypothetical protein